MRVEPRRASTLLLLISLALYFAGQQVRAQDLQLSPFSRVADYPISAAADRDDDTTLVSWLSYVRQDTGARPVLRFALMNANGSEITRGSLTTLDSAVGEVYAVIARPGDFLVLYANVAVGQRGLWGRSVDRRGVPGPAWLISTALPQPDASLPSIRRILFDEGAVRLLWMAGNGWHTRLLGAKGGPDDSERALRGGIRNEIHYGARAGTLLLLEGAWSYFYNARSGRLADSVPSERFSPMGLMGTDGSMLVLGADSVRCFRRPSDSAAAWGVAIDSTVARSTMLLLRDSVGRLILQWTEHRPGAPTSSGLATELAARHRALLDTSIGRMSAAFIVDTNRCYFYSHKLVSATWEAGVESSTGCGNALRHDVILTGTDTHRPELGSSVCTFPTFRGPDGRLADTLESCTPATLTPAVSLTLDAVTVRWADGTAERLLVDANASRALSQTSPCIVVDANGRGVIYSEGTTFKGLRWPAKGDLDAVPIYSCVPTSGIRLSPGQTLLSSTKLFHADGTGALISRHNRTLRVNGRDEYDFTLAATWLGSRGVRVTDVDQVRAVQGTGFDFGRTSIAIAPDIDRVVVLNCRTPSPRLATLSPEGDAKYVVGLDLCAGGLLLDFDSSAREVLWGNSLLRYVDGALRDSVSFGGATSGGFVRRLDHDHYLRVLPTVARDSVTLSIVGLSDGHTVARSIPFPTEESPSAIVVAARPADRTFALVSATSDGVHMCLLTQELDLVVEDSVISDPVAVPSSPSATFIGDTLVTVWEDLRPGRPAIYGRLLFLPSTVAGVDHPQRSVSASLTVRCGTTLHLPESYRHATSVEVFDLNGESLGLLAVDENGHLDLPPGLCHPVLLQLRDQAGVVAALYLHVY